MGAAALGLMALREAIGVSAGVAALGVAAVGVVAVGVAAVWVGVVAVDDG